MVQYYFKVSDGPSLGPMGADEFRQRQEAGEIDDRTMVWRSGMVEWSTYATLRSSETAASPSSKAPIRKEKTSSAAASPRPGFLACAACGQEWAEALLFTEGKRQICGNCQTRLKEAAENGRPKAGAGTSMTAWFFIALAIVSTACLTYKLMHPGPPQPRQKVAELSAPATYGK